MSSPLPDVLLYTSLPVVATILGGAVAVFRAPSPRVKSGIQHFAAGVVFAAAAGEVLPELMHEHAPIPTTIGFALGVALMLLIKALTKNEEKEEGTKREAGKVSSGLIFAVAVDISIDGLLVGVGFAAGEKQGLLLTVALTLEVLFLGVATAAELAGGGMKRGRVVAMIAGLAGLLAIGATVGALLSSVLTGAALVGVLGFGAAALLYLVTEELLVEAHEVPETPLTTAVFFAGFLLLFLIEMMV
jgi:zinc transporter, ZIP family